MPEGHLIQDHCVVGHIYKHLLSLEKGGPSIAFKMTQRRFSIRRASAQVTLSMVMIVTRVAEVVMVLSTPPLGWPFPKSVLRLSYISVCSVKAVHIVTLHQMQCPHISERFLRKLLGTRETLCCRLPTQT